MEISGEQHIATSRETVWRALNDPEILRRAIPGCQTLEKVSDSEMAATVTLKVGPVKANFAGKVTLSDLDPPNGYTITGQGSGGPAGLAKGNAEVRLESVEGGTRLTYKAHADLSGKIAQLGGRLVESTARRLSDQFFTAFKGAVETEEGVPAPEAAPAAAVAPPEAPARGRTWLWWTLAGLLALAALLAVLFA